MKISGFVMAVRFQKNFTLEDNLGTLMDYLVKHPSNLFGHRVFKEYSSFKDQRVILDEKKDNKLTLNSENIVLEFNTLEKGEEDFNKYIDAYEKIILGEVFNKFNISKIDRFGCVFKTSGNKNEDIFKEIEAVLKKYDKEPESLSLRFNCVRKTPKKIKDVVTTDYHNEISSFDREKKDSPVDYYIDYQHYFQPPLEKITDADQSFLLFCKSSLKKFKEEYKID